MRMTPTLLLIYLMSFSNSVTAQTEKIPAEQLRFFEEKIRPTLVKHCYRCHSVESGKKQGGLHLDTRAHIQKGGDTGPAVVPKNVNASLLIQAIRYDKQDLQMPPKGKLEKNVIADLERWVAMGAPDPRESKSTEVGSTKKADNHWAFQPPTMPTIPKTKDIDWPGNPIDAFILVKLEQQSLTPSADADRFTLMRRWYFDLIGLPPDPDSVERFMNDPSPDAHEQFVDSLLSSPHFGERWGRYWLDVSRYADTKGYVFTKDRNYYDAYKFRDWVVQSLNQDLPYDQFLLQQLVADQLPKEQQALDAMGFLTLGRRFLNNTHDIIDDRIDVVTRGLMGLTVTCARCHDHKYDPIPTKDYYSLYGVFASSREPKSPPSTLRLVDASRPFNPQVFLRGNPANRGERVPRQFLAVLSPDGQKPFKHGSGRLELAQAIIDPNNPLTARVFVNRVWAHLFGKGLVEGPSDFGTRSDLPSHPQLLDYLALKFIEENWSVKRLIRRIVLSRTYQQQSQQREQPNQVDPENRLLWRMNRRRLDFEAMRDFLLSAAGQLDTTIGGKSIKLTKKPYPNRRTIYGFIDRQNLPGLFRTFDFAGPDTHSPKRYQTSVPQQALYLLNAPFVIEQAVSLMNRPEIVEASNPLEKLRRLYRAVYAHWPTEQELSILMAFLANPSNEQGLTSWQRLAQVLMIANEFQFID